MRRRKKRDHRKLGKQLNFFHLRGRAAGSVFWHPNGWTIYREIETYMRRRLEDGDYAGVKTPQLVDRALWEASGHWDKFRENMFTAEAEDDRTLALKPMNCPCHVQIFRQGIKSYRDLPLRMAGVRPVTTTSRRARCAASCGCAPLPRMTRISSVPRTRSPQSPCGLRAAAVHLCRFRV